MKIDLKKIFGKDHIIGLDIGSSSVKLAQFSEGGDGKLCLVRAELKELKRFEDEALWADSASSALAYLLRGINVKRSRIIASINCPQTAIKKVTAPYMPKAELREGIRMEAKNYFPFPVDESILDFEILGDVVEKGVRKYELIVAVSPKKTVERYLSLLRKAGIRQVSFISTSYALENLAKYSRLSDGETKCYIDIGEVYTELIIAKGKYLVFSRKIPVAGGDFTRALTGTLISDRGKTELSFDEAERIKQEVGIPSGTESKIIQDKISTIQMLSMLRSPMEQLAGEIERSFDYYREESGGGKVDSVMLFGGGASLGGLIKSLSESLGVEVKLGDPLDSLNMKKDAMLERSKISYRLESAVGAALNGAKGINLLPAEIKEGTKRTVRRGTLEGAAVAILLILIFVYIGMRIQLVNFQRRISAARLEFSSLEPQLKKAEAQMLASKVLLDEPQWEDIFKELSNLIPPEIHLENIRMENNVITMKGVASTEDDEQAITNFILTLEKGLFSNVRLVSTKKLDGETGSEFELKCWVDYE